MHAQGSPQLTVSWSFSLTGMYVGGLGNCSKDGEAMRFVLSSSMGLLGSNSDREA